MWNRYLRCSPSQSFLNTSKVFNSMSHKGRLLKNPVILLKNIKEKSEQCSQTRKRYLITDMCLGATYNMQQPSLHQHWAQKRGLHGPVNRRYFYLSSAWLKHNQHVQIVLWCLMNVGSMPNLKRVPLTNKPYIFCTHSPKRLKTGPPQISQRHCLQTICQLNNTKWLLSFIDFHFLKFTSPESHSSPVLSKLWCSSHFN